MTLTEIATEIEERVEKTTNPGALDIWTMLGELVDNLVSAPKAGDAVLIASLQAQLATLQEQYAGQIRGNNSQAGVLQRIKEALEAPDSLTMEQLPIHAKAIMAWAKTGTKPV